MINIKPSRKGLLHEKLGVPQGKPIPAGKLATAKQSKSPALRKEATFAENAKGWDKSGGKPQAAAPKAPKEPTHPQSHDAFLKLGA
jgi:hypothetical protein